MKYAQIIVVCIMGFMGMNCASAPRSNLPAQRLDPVALKAVEAEIEAVMERIDVEGLAAELPERERAAENDKSIVCQARLGIFYHEVALNLGMGKSKKYKGYAKKSYDALSEALSGPDMTPELASFCLAYRASALALWAGEKGDLGKLDAAFSLFADAVALYGLDNYAPRFLRGSVAESLPPIFGKANLAREDFETLIKQEEASPGFVHSRVLSFTYWAWANNRYKDSARLSPADRVRAVDYLEKAIALDPRSSIRVRQKEIRRTPGENPYAVTRIGALSA
jgi:tetratricopeptide (TPR) repeat protein